MPFSLHFGNYIDGMSRSDRPEIIDDRVGNKATIFTSLDRRTLASLDRRGDYRDAILDRACSAITASRWPATRRALNGQNPPKGEKSHRDVTATVKI
jgi:hypothetical protein